MVTMMHHRICGDPGRSSPHKHNVHSRYAQSNSQNNSLTLLTFIVCLPFYMWFTKAI